MKTLSCRAVRNPQGQACVWPVPFSWGHGLNCPSIPRAHLHPTQDSRCHHPNGHAAALQLELISLIIYDVIFSRRIGHSCPLFKSAEIFYLIFQLGCLFLKNITSLCLPLARPQSPPNTPTAQSLRGSASEIIHVLLPQRSSHVGPVTSMLPIFPSSRPSLDPTALTSSYSASLLPLQNYL